MPDMINPMQDMGFMQDKQAIVEPQGFLTPSNAARALCEHFIPDGGKIFDLIDRYDNVSAYVLNRDDTAHSADVMRMVAPFLRAYGASDYSIRRFYDGFLAPAPGAARASDYLLQSMPLYICTSMYEHAADSLCEKLGIPISLVNATGMELDGAQISAKGCRALRGLAEEIARLKLPKDKYRLDVQTELSADEVSMVGAMDDIFMRRLQATPAYDIVQSMESVGANQKAYSLLDIRKSTQVDLDGTVYIGGETIDYQVMDLVKDGSGLALSFDGSEFAVHGANVAVISEDCTVAAVLVSEFYDTGIQGVFDLVDNWNGKYLREGNVSDRNLVDAMLASNPKKLPEVIRITKDNVDEVAERSDAFRKRMFAKHSGKTASP